MWGIDSTMAMATSISRCSSRRPGIVPTDYNESKKFIPKHTKLDPGRRLLHLDILVVIAMLEPIPHIHILQHKSFKKYIWSYSVNHFLLMTGNLNTSPIKKLCEVL